MLSPDNLTSQLEPGETVVWRGRPNHMPRRILVSVFISALVGAIWLAFQSSMQLLGVDPFWGGALLALAVALAGCLGGYIIHIGLEALSRSSQLFAVTDRRAIVLSSLLGRLSIESVRLDEVTCQQGSLSIRFFRGARAALTMLPLTPADRWAIMQVVAALGTRGPARSDAYGAHHINLPAENEPVEQSLVASGQLVGQFEGEVEIWRGKPVEAPLFAQHRLSLAFGVACAVLVIAALFIVVTLVKGSGLGWAVAMTACSAVAIPAIQLRTRARFRSTEYILTNLRARILWSAWPGLRVAESWRLAADSPIELKNGHPYDVVVAMRRVKLWDSWVLEPVSFEQVADGPTVFQILTELIQKRAT